MENYPIGRRILIMAGALPIALTGSAVTQADTLRVPSEYTTIQDAVDAATHDDVVLLADGTFKGPGNYDVDLLGKTITIRSENGRDACTIDCEGNGRAVIIDSGEGLGTSLDGLTIRNGYVDEDWHGGAVLCSDSNLSVTRCRFINNACEGTADNFWGGAIGAVNADLQIHSTEFIANHAMYSGGAVGIAGGRLILSSSTFQDNTVGEYGGGAVYATGYFKAMDCDFERNVGWMMNARGGAVYADGLYIDCRFFENECADGDGFGGAVYGDGTFAGCEFGGNNSIGGAIWTNWSTMIECRFEANSGYQGGAVFGDGEFFDCTFVENGGGAVKCSAASVFNHCVFERNRATDIYQIAGAVEGGGQFVDCLFDGNSSRNGDLTDSLGGAVNSPDAAFLNCTFVRNSSETAGGAVYGGWLFDRCTFEGNLTGGIGDTHLQSGGAICTSANTLIYESIFRDNGCEGVGGAVAILGGHARLEKSRFLNNNAHNFGAGDGGAVYLRSGDAVIHECDFRINTCDLDGGALCNSTVEPGTLIVAASTFCQNTNDHISGTWIDLAGNSFSNQCDCLDFSLTNLVAGESATLSVSYGLPGHSVAVLWSNKDGAFKHESRGWCVNFGFELPWNPSQRVIAYGQFDDHGNFERRGLVRSDLSGTTLRFQAAMRDTCPDTCMSNIWIDTIE